MTNLKRIREEAGLSQSKLAEAAGLSIRTLQYIEQGRRDINKTAAITVYNLAKVLNVPIESLLELCN